MRKVAPRDPAPSRLAYRLHRLWLTPLFWRALRIGVPVGAVALGAGLWLGDAGRRAALVDGAAELRARFESRPEFSIDRMEIAGAEGRLAETVRAAADLNLPMSSFDLDPAALRARLEALDAVRAVRVNVQPGGTLHVAVEERVPALVHRTGEGLLLRDETGHRIAPLEARDPDAPLPLVAGAGAEAAAPEALALHVAAAPLSESLRGLVRVGDRRWDAILTGDRRILLPEEDPVPALEQVIAYDAAQDLLSRQVMVIDMRDPARPTLRLGEHALDELRRIRTEPTGSTSR